MKPKSPYLSTNGDMKVSAALFGAVVIALGFAPIPWTDPLLPKSTWFEFCFSVLPILPFFILTMSAISQRRIGALAIPLLSDLPVIGPILFDQHLLTYIALLSVPFISYFLLRTTRGLEVRAAGENPQFLESKGLSVSTRQYGAVLFGSALTALGGAFLMLAFADQFRPDISGGRGWLAIVAVIAGNWQPVRTMFAVLVFAVLDSVAVHA